MERRMHSGCAQKAGVRERQEGRCVVIDTVGQAGEEDAALSMRESSRLFVLIFVFDVSTGGRHILPEEEAKGDLWGMHGDV
jgi:hypothetical protein